MKDLRLECEDLEKRVERQLRHAKEVEQDIKQQEEKASGQRKEIDRRMEQLKEREVNLTQTKKFLRRMAPGAVGCVRGSAERSKK